MARKAFFSFHYDADNWRVSQVRNIHVVEENRVLSSNEWEQVKKGGDTAIQRWIDGEMYGKSCVIVLVGTGTANRKWINYEISKGWNDGKGVVGVRINGLKDRLGNTSQSGANPFDYVTFTNSQAKLSSIVRLIDPTSPWGSTQTYANIKNDIAEWVEAAIQLRAKY
jgi:hypothetical protein